MTDLSESVSSKQVVIHTDGACHGNPGPGGYGIVLLYNGVRKELAEGFRRTTNNRMEMLGAIMALEALKEPCQVTLHTDSSYLVNGIEKGWAKRWKANGWIKSDRQPALNVDLWERLLQLTEKHQVKLQWVRGHAGNIENERCDQLATKAALRPDLPTDTGYVDTRPPARPPARRRF